MFTAEIRQVTMQFLLCKQGISFANWNQPLRLLSISSNPFSMAGLKVLVIHLSAAWFNNALWFGEEHN